MAEERRAVAELAGAVLDGTPVDWDAAASTTAPVDRDLVPHLRVVARIAQAHRLEPAADLTAWAHLALRGRIGTGAFGDVYRAWDTRLEREVALKLLKPGPERDDRSSVVAEAALLARVRHPNIVTVYGAERSGGRVGLWMELVEGRGLDQVLREQGPFGAHEAAVVGLTVCRALSAVHRNGLLHRDVKAQNVMREDGGRIVLMDFGTGLGADRRTTRLAGTPLYVAPELLAGGEPSVASDIYSVGILLFHLATARFPVGGADLDGLREAHAEGRRRFLRDERPDLPDDFIAVVEKAMATHPSQRFRTAGAMEAALAGVVGSGGRLDPRPRGRLILASVAAAGSILAALAVTQGWTAGGQAKGGGESNLPPPAAAPLSAARPFKISVRQVDLPDARSAGRPSPDGRWFSFVRDDGDLALLEVATREVRRLTAHAPDTGEHAESSAISADGRLVAYTWMALDGHYEMRVVGADGRRARVLLRSQTVDEPQPIEWSRDGSSILSVLTTAEGTSRLALVPVVGGEATTLRQLAAAPLHASRSPDGALVVFDAPQDPAAVARDILIMDAAGGDARPLVAHPANDVSPVWTPDGSHVVFASDRSGTMDLWSVTIAAGAPVGEPELVHRGTGRMRLLGLTDEGAYYFQSLVGAVEVYSAELLPGGRVGRPAPLGSTYAGSNISSAWSPDGLRVAYSSRRGLVGFDRGSTTLAVVDLATNRQRDVVPVLNHFMVRSWSADSTRVIALGTDTRRRSGLFSIDVDTGDARPLILADRASDDTGIGGGQWTAEGGVLYQRGGALRVRHPRRGTDEVVLDYAAEGIDWIDGVPAGRGAVMADDGMLAFSGVIEAEGARTGVLRLKPRGGQSRELLRVAGERLVLQDMTRDGGSVLFTRKKEGERSALWRVGTAGGPPEHLAIDLKAVRDVSLHPDGSRITFTAGVPLLEVWMIDNILSANPLAGTLR